MSEAITKVRPQDRLVLELLRVADEKLRALDAEMATDEQLRTDTLDGETDILEKLRHKIREALAAEDWAAAIRERERINANRRYRLEQKAETCRAFVKEALGILNLKSLVADDFTVSVRDGAPSLNIDMDALPRIYKRIKEEPEKPMIRSALANGKEVPGVTLGNSSPILTVRTS